jgi:catecholate siderophore receptor
MTQTHAQDSGSVLVRRPRALRQQQIAGRNLALAAGPLAVAVLATAGEAVAETATLPALKVDAPAARPKPAAPRVTSSAHNAARQAIRAKAAPLRAATAPRASVASPPPSAQASAPSAPRAVDASPYANEAAPYKPERLASGKFSERIANTPRTVTVLSKELLRDKQATALRDLGRTTSGVTLGTGEGGNAFGDRFFIRGFDARNDVFIDGVRDPAVSVRENFFTEQVEILRGPASTFSGRGTAGGAINVVSKKASFDKDFLVTEGTLGRQDKSGRFTLDVNRVISPILAVRANALKQEGGTAGRNGVDDNRWGGQFSVVFKPVERLQLEASYLHTDLRGMPDFGVPYVRAMNRPVTEFFTPRETWYGQNNRDFQKVRQDMLTASAQFQATDWLTLSSKFRRSESVLDYVGTLAQGASLATGLVNQGAQSRKQWTSVIATQNDATAKFNTGDWKHTFIAGFEITREQLIRDSYAGLNSELAGGAPALGGSTTTSFVYPNNWRTYFSAPYLAGAPIIMPVDTKGYYLIANSSWRDFLYLNAGARYDVYDVGLWNSASYVQNHARVFNYNVGALVKVLPNVGLYGAYATSSNPVGSEMDALGNGAYGGLTLTNSLFGPERNKSIEFGVKSEWFDGRLLATLALYRTDKTNAREIFGANVYAGAAYRVQGVDLALAGNLTDKWSVSAGATFMWSKILNSQAPTNKGLMLANIAHQSFNMMSKYKITQDFEIGGQATWRSRIYGGTTPVANGATAINPVAFLPAPTLANPFVNIPTVLPSYWRFDAFAEAKLGENLKLKAAVDNIFNRTYYDAFYQSAAPFALMGPGRRMSLSLKGTF